MNTFETQLQTPLGSKLERSTKKTQKMLLVDVRTSEEFLQGHIPGATNIDWFSKDFSAAFKGMKKRQKIYVYCRSGKRSAKAAALLDSLGFKRVVNLLGGYKAYQELK
jgi:rhodanese-related sulfurtransferase